MTHSKPIPTAPEDPSYRFLIPLNRPLTPSALPRPGTQRARRRFRGDAWWGSTDGANMAAHTLLGLCRPRPGLALLCARFSQRAAAGTEYRSSHSLDKLYPPRQDGTASRTTVRGAGGKRKTASGRGLLID